jgi:hypothetical protein
LKEVSEVLDVHEVGVEVVDFIELWQCEGKLGTLCNVGVKSGAL